MSLDDKEAQIRALLDFEWRADLGPLIVDREEILDTALSQYVRIKPRKLVE